MKRAGALEQPRTTAIRVPVRAAIVLARAAFLGVVAFFWPFFVAPGTFGSRYAPLAIFGALLVLILCVVISEIAEGGINSKALAMLGVLSAVNAAIRPLGAGTAGIETVFFILVLAGRVYGPGFGFTLGCTSLFASALITGGVGPWMPYQMFGCAFVGMLAGLLPRATGRREVLLLAVYGGLSGLPLRLPAQPLLLAVLPRPQQLDRLPAGPALHRAVAAVRGLRPGHLTGLGHRPGRHEHRLHHPRGPSGPDSLLPRGPQGPLPGPGPLRQGGQGGVGGCRTERTPGTRSSSPGPPFSEVLTEAPPESRTAVEVE